MVILVTMNIAGVQVTTAHTQTLEPITFHEPKTTNERDESEHPTPPDKKLKVNEKQAQLLKR